MSSPLERYKGATVADLPEELASWDWIQRDRAPFLWGPAGTGKTHAAVALHKQYAHGRNVPFVSMARMFKDKRAAISRNEAFDGEPNWKTITGVVLDDLDKLRITDWVREELFIIIDTLYGRCAPVLITTNLSPRAFAAQVGPFVSSRLKEMVKSYALHGDDRRGQAHYAREVSGVSLGEPARL